MSELPEDGPRRRLRSPDLERPPGGVRSGFGTFWGRLGLLALIPFVLYTFYTVVAKTAQTYRLSRDAAIVRAEIEAEKRENLRLQQELAEADSDWQIEDSARRYLNLVRPGDHAVVLVGVQPPPPAASGPASRPDLPDDLPPWLDWLVTRLGL